MYGHPLLVAEHAATLKPLPEQDSQAPANPDEYIDGMLMEYLERAGDCEN